MPTARAIIRNALTFGLNRLSPGEQEDADLFGRCLDALGSIVDEITGTEVTRLGKRHAAESVIRATNPRGEAIYWIGPAGSARDAGPGTDFNAVAERRVSITPLDADLTGSQWLDPVRDWLAR